MKQSAAALIALALFMSHIASAHAFNIGWNFIRANNCLGLQFEGVDYFYIYPTTGGELVTIDPIAITALAPLCASGDGFFIYWTGTTWNGVSVYPSIK